MVRPDPERTRRYIGFVLFAIGVLVGGLLLVALFLFPPLVTEGVSAVDAYAAMMLGALLAFPAGVMYLTVPRLLDRYDPEPWYALLGCLAWGAFAACGISAAINSTVLAVGTHVGDSTTGTVLATTVSAPLVEEFWKGIGVLGIFYFLKREFDGVVDGIIYATFIALGFATVENVVYYGRAAMEPDSQVLAITFGIRGVLAPWGHPLYTAMTGIGFGLAREASNVIVRSLAPFVGYVLAVALHAAWNGMSVIAPQIGEDGITMFFMLMPLWLLFVGTFLLIVIILVRRRGRIIREFLADELYIGTLAQRDVDLVCSAFGLMTAKYRYGADGEELVRAAARLALSKWHMVRAQKTSRKTLSVQFVVPLREELKSLRAKIDAKRK